MTHIVRYSTEVPDFIFSGIAQLAHDNTHELSMLGVARSSPLYPYYQAYLIVEIGTLLSMIGRPHGGEVIVAVSSDNPSKVMGFLIYVPLKDLANECGVCYVCVESTSRRQGVFDRMMDLMRENYPLATVSCAIEHVPMYQRRGFKIKDFRETHIVMDSGTTPGAIMRLPDAVALVGNQLVVSANERMLRQHSEADIRKAQKQLARSIAETQKKAKTFAQYHLADAKKRGSAV